MRHLSDNQHKALHALEEADRALGYAEWRNLSGVPKGSFARVRGALLAKRLVAQEGDTYRLVSPNSDTTPDTSTIPIHADASQAGSSTANTGQISIDRGNSKRRLHADAYGNCWWEELENPKKTWHTNERGEWWLA